jgi:Flp pilus assembly protein TadG
MIPLRRDAQSGSAAVEFALVLVPLLLALLGTIDWGYHLYIRETIVNAAREGARAGSIDPGTEVARANEFLERAGLARRAAVCGGPVADSACVEITYPTASVTGFAWSIVPEEATARAVMRIE